MPYADHTSQVNLSYTQELEQKYADLQAEHAKMLVEYEQMLNWQDRAVGLLRNHKISQTYKALYLALVDTYPGVLLGQTVPIQVWRIREAAGWPSEKSATNFFRDFSQAGIWTYDSGQYEKQKENRVGFITADPEKIEYVEDFSTEEFERKRRAQDRTYKEKKRFERSRQIWQCEECASKNIIYTAIPTCGDCGHEHESITGIPASMITIEAEIIELADESPDFLETDAGQCSPDPAQQTPAQLSFQNPGKHPRGIPCPDCGQLDKWIGEQTSWGGEIFVCTKCYPDGLEGRT